MNQVTSFSTTPASSSLLIEHAVYKRFENSEVNIVERDPEIYPEARNRDWDLNDLLVMIYKLKMMKLAVIENQIEQWEELDDITGWRQRPFGLMAAQLSLNNESPEKFITNNQIIRVIDDEIEYLEDWISDSSEDCEPLRQLIHETQKKYPY